MNLFKTTGAPKWFDDAGKLLLRLMVGGMMLPHGVAKITGGVAGISGMLTAKGLPQFLAYGVYVGELMAPALIVAGLWSRPAALVLTINMVVATLLAHSGDLLSLGPHGGWAIELQAFYLFGAVAVFLLGAGRYSVSKSKGPMD